MIAMRLLCPFCGNDMILKGTDKYRHRDGSLRTFYACSAYPRCKAVCGAHPDGTPSSTPADPETKLARMRAHEAFDKLWKTGRMTRPAAYVYLQKLMGLGRDEAHIGFFDKDQCESLIELLSRSRYFIPEKGDSRGPYTGFRLHLPRSGEGNPGPDLQGVPGQRWAGDGDDRRSRGVVPLQAAGDRRVAEAEDPENHA